MLPSTLARRLLSAALGIALAAGLGVAVAAVATGVDPAPAQASVLNGKISRSEVLARAQNWVDRGITYTQTGPHASDPEGDHSYRRDCSGFVSMVWHLGTSYTTDTFPDAGLWTRLSSLHDLLPGDTVHRDGHMELFVRWVDAADHGDGAYVYSFNSTGETVQNPYKVTNFGNLGKNSWSNMETFKPYRYKNIVEDLPQGTAQIYGVVADGRLSYSEINAANGNRKSVVLSTTKLGFTATAMATLNYNTLLVVSSTSALWRIDVVSLKGDITYSKTKVAADGWGYDHLAYDGHGHLFGLVDGLLRRIDVTVGTHSFRVDNSRVIDTGFALQTLTATGNNWLLGTTSAGRLISYDITDGGGWRGADLKSSGWGGVQALLSPGGGVYYAQYPSSAMYHYRDAAPYDLNGSDISYFLDDPVDPGGWTQILLSARPGNVS